MSQINTREVVLINGASVTTSGTGPDINIIMGFQAAVVTVQVTARTGTLPTLDVYIQRRLTQVAATDLVGGIPTGTPLYDDVIHFSQINSVQTRVANIVTGQALGTANTLTNTNNDWTNSNLALGAGTLRVGPLGGIWACNWVIGGTTPVFTFSVVAQLIPFNT